MTRPRAQLEMLHLYLSRATELGIADSGHLNGGGSVAAAIIMKTFPDSGWPVTSIAQR